jgi:hypothetical protein
MAGRENEEREGKRGGEREGEGGERERRAVEGTGRRESQLKFDNFFGYFKVAQRSHNKGEKKIKCVTFQMEISCAQLCVTFSKKEFGWGRCA